MTEALLFDLGGVIVELDWNRVFSHWARCAGKPVELIRERFGFDPAYELHERGEIDAPEYYESLRRTLGIDIPDDEFAAGWKALFVREIPATTELIRLVQDRIPTYIFSNSNPAHREAWSTRFAGALAPFRGIFVSSDIGLRKPMRKSFEHVAREIGVSLEAILFFDDMLENVEGARAAGMHAVHVRSPGDVERALRPWLASA